MAKLTLKKSVGLSTQTKAALPVKPSFDSLMGVTPARPDENPILVETEGMTVEDVTAAEVENVLDLIRAGREQRMDAFRLRNDRNFYLVVCFQSVDQRDEFVEAMKWDKRYLPFLDGLAVAQRLGVTIKAQRVTPPKPFVVPTSLRKGVKLDG